MLPISRLDQRRSNAGNAESADLKLSSGRRRKTKCTYREGRQSKCEECYARGSPCVAQDKGSKTTTTISAASTKADGNNDEAKYSLRERVARLEDFVGTYLSNESATKSSDTGRNHSQRNSRVAYTGKLGIVCTSRQPVLINKATTDSTPDGPAPTYANGHFKSNPILSLFDNDVITRAGRTAGPSLIETAATTEPSGFHPARYELLILLPQEPDLNTLVELSKDWWNSAPHRFPELFDRAETTAEDWRSVLNHKLSLANPAETAKALLWTLISAERLSEDVFRDSTFRDPTAIATLESRILPAIDRAVVFEDDIAITLPGIECLILLSRYYCNQGRLRKAWHLCRRSLEYAISIGLDGSPAESGPILPDQPRHRQIDVWGAICFLDRYLSLLLGFPYGVRHSSLDLPKRGSETTQNTSQQATFVHTAMSSIIGQIIDRNQQLLDDHDSLLRTLKIDRELKQVMDNVDTVRWDADSRSSDPHIQEAFERIEAYFLMHFIQALLHLPLMLKCIGKGDKGVFQYSYGASTRASRQALVAYKYLRVGLRIDPYLCTMLDFQAFTMSALLVLHLLGQKTECNEEANREYAIEAQDERDWKSIADVTDILRQASTHNSKNIVAKQAVEVLDLLLGEKGDADERFNSCPQAEFDGGERCQIQINIPCFGEVTIARGVKRSPYLCPSAPANTTESPPCMTAALLPLTGQEETVPNPADLCTMTVSVGDGTAALFDGNWNVLARNVASAVATHSE
ncbi:uncharacterized protein Z520_04517 [Fonsecaea multimorphosa CBS 102226]|uniref:Xylanolytic transcriptional activator regulatory domain-containing protein n=1 Tax=Fonsecaea multimorphosa CBS 102226 TaxID=1442371 RepID=A0A0D2ISC5_9EURO|nr:uncharacterized protein Z520_04517 [Fonsecaea multimorphosa CBS 102226]KIX99881.1 hypothetical protein Z520_04517 [Fonsecaea multimorphosa CBS 102226]